MREDFLRLRTLLQGGGEQIAPDTFQEHSFRRLANALRTGAVGEADVVSLIAHILRREEALAPKQVIWLRVPAATTQPHGGITWPRPAAWQAASLGVRDERGQYKLTPRHWYPTWLPEQNGEALTRPLFAEELRRTYSEVGGDPFLSAIGRSRYRCDAQREAIRAIMSVPAGATVVVNLPTGAGKSLCAALPAILRSQRAGVSIVVVPTTALALDQERAVEEWIPHHTAYVGATTALEKERNRQIRDRIRDGTQRIVFTSPEGLLQSLRPAVYDAVRRALLRYFVIDEAHMVEQWGDEFRSAFQEVAGLRTDLRRHVPVDTRTFTTVLLTATLTEAALDTLETLYGRPGPLTVVSAAQLRPEPSYWAVRAQDENEQTAILLEAISHLPRPLLLYLTEPEHAETWGARLRAIGYQRVDVVTGGTPNEERARVIRRWRDADTDIVVATSAFGLGVDQGEVRAVVHATLPENVDRFYQEVGRGGRDGLACASLVVYTPADVARAESMNQKKIIGIERGQERWARMFDRREDLGDGRIRVPVDVQPSLRPGDINMDNDLNRAWNIRTLTLMSRAKLLELDAEPPPPPNVEASPVSEAEARDRTQRLLQLHQRHRIVSLLHDGTNSKEVWEREIQPVRRRTRMSDQRSHELMLEMLRGSRCVADVLAEAYTIPARLPESTRAGISVARACGGCAHCRSRGIGTWADPLPTAFPQWKVDEQDSEGLRALRQSGRGLAVFYSSVQAHRMSRLIQWLISQGVRVITAPAASIVEFSTDLQRVGSAGEYVFTYPLEDFHFLRAPRLPALVYLPPGTPLPSHLRNSLSIQNEETSARILIAPAELRDPNKPDNLLRTMLNCATYDFEELSLKVGL